MKYGKKIVIWHECYVTGGSDWSIIDILSNWSNKNQKFDFFVNRKHESVKLLKKNLYKNCDFTYYNSIIENFNKIKKKKIYDFLINIFFLRKLILAFILLPTFFEIHNKLKKKTFNYILINNGGYPGGLTSYLVILSAFILRKKVSMIIRNFPSNTYKNSILMILTKFIIEKCNCKLISVSHSLKKSLYIDARLDRKNIKVIYNGISIANRKIFKNKKKIILKKNCVGIFGRIEERKGHHILLDSWRLIEKKLPDLYLYIVGNGNKKYIQQLKNFIKIKHLNKKKIIWLNYTNDIYSLIEKIDLVVVPSISYESFGRIAVEAMALKKPIITSDFGGLKEINRNKITGFVVSKNNSKLLADKVIKLMTNKKRRLQFGISGYKNYRKNFTSIKMANKYYNFVNKKL